MVNINIIIIHQKNSKTEENTLPIVEKKYLY